MPLAAYGGRRDVMSCVAPCGSVYQAGTLSGNPIAVTAAFADYFGWMLGRGIYVAPSQFEAMFVSAAHTEEMIERTCECIREYVGNVKK